MQVSRYRAVGAGGAVVSVGQASRDDEGGRSTRNLHELINADYLAQSLPAKTETRCKRANSRRFFDERCDTRGGGRWRGIISEEASSVTGRLRLVDRGGRWAVFGFACGMLLPLLMHAQAASQHKHTTTWSGRHVRLKLWRGYLIHFP
jgi:hypothetical protein